MRNLLNLLTSFLLLFILCCHSVAQIKIQGTVSDKSKVPISGVNVILSDKHQNNILSYSLTDSKGKYSLTYQGSADSLQITLRSLDYEKVVRIIPAISQTIDFDLKVEPIEIKEVKVKAEPIVERGDTVSYYVANFTTESDRVIEDILKKLPGIEVSESGSITYQGKPITKFYIENMDMLQGRYSLATRNISVQDVATVEVYENHQPIKALSKTHLSDRAAINLKLKENAKGILSIISQLGVGATPLLWDNELITLFFAKKYQNLNTYKFNNSGNDVSREFTVFYSDAEPLLFEGRMLSVLSPNPPPINRQRYLFNNIHAASANVLHALNNDNQITANILYYNDVQKRESYSRSSYFISDNDKLLLEETINNKTIANYAAATIKLESNKDNFFLNNAFNYNVSITDNKGVTETVDTIGQKLKTDVYNLANTFEMIKNIKGQDFVRLYSFNGYSLTPQNLSIKPAFYAENLTPDKLIDELNQQTIFQNFSSKTYISYWIHNQRFLQGYWGGFEASVQSLDSELHCISNNSFSLSDSLQNDLLWQKYIALLSCAYTYTLQNLRIELYLPLSYNFLFINDKFPDNKKTVNRIFFNPNLSLIYDFAKNWSVKTGYSFNNRFGNIHDSYTGYIMRNYRSFTRNDGLLADVKSNSVSLQTNYRNVRKALFAHINLFYEQFTSNLVREQFYNGLLQMQTSIPKSITSETRGVGGSISRNVFALRTTFSVSGNYYNVSSSQLVQNKLVDYNYIYYILRPKIETNLTSFSGITYTLLWNESKNVIEKKHNPSIRSVSNFIRLNIYPINRLEIYIGYENYYNSAISNNKYKSFADLGINYRYKRTDFSLSWINILNMHQYNSATYADLNEFIYVYEIRPSQVLFKMRFKLL